MGVRTEVATYLTAHLPATWRVFPYATNLDGLTDPTVLVEQKKVEPAAAAGLRTVTLEVTVTVPGEDLSKVEDKLEDALYILLDVLDEVPHVAVSADRGVINGTTLHAYAVTIEVPAVITN